MYDFNYQCKFKRKMYCIYRFSNPSQILSLGIIPKIFLEFIFIIIKYILIGKKECIHSRRILRA